MDLMTPLPSTPFAAESLQCGKNCKSLTTKLLVLGLSLILGACSNTQIKPWGSDSTFSPGWQLIKRSAKESFYNRETWLPLAGAAVFGFTNLDRKVSDYAVEHSPIYGDSQLAIEKSDYVFTFTKIAFFTSSLATAGDDDFNETLRVKAKGLAAQSMAIGLNNLFTGELKTLAKRIPPNNINDDSLTSRHASGAFLYSSLSRQNMRHITTSDSWQTSTDITMIGLASVTAWGRVEGALHYPSDVLVGAAMGNFFANFIHNAFVDPSDRKTYSIQLIKTRIDSRLSLIVKF